MYHQLNSQSTCDLYSPFNYINNQPGKNNYTKCYAMKTKISLQLKLLLWFFFKYQYFNPKLFRVFIRLNHNPYSTLY